MRRILVLFSALELILSACATLDTTPGTPTPEISATPTVAATASLEISTPASSEEIPTASPTARTEPKLGMASSSAQIRKAMLQSADEWTSIWMDGTVTWYSTDGSNTPAQVYHEQVWIEPATARFRTLLGPSIGAAEQFTACDGNTVLKIDLKTGASQSSSLPTFAKNAPADSSPHLLWGQIGTPLSEIALSSNYATDQGIYMPTGTETVAGRETLVVEWTRTGTDLLQWRMWLDTRTAVILKFQEFGKGGGKDVIGERVVNQVVYDAAFADELFHAPVSLPRFGDMTGSASGPVPTAVGTSSR
jgi:hypothetical protein